MQRHQRGMTLGKLIAVVLLAASLFWVGSKFVPVYVEYVHVKSSLDSLKLQASDRRLVDNLVRAEQQLRSTLIIELNKRLIKNITRRDILISYTKEGFVVGVRYDRRVHFFGDYSITLAFNNAVLVPTQSDEDE